MSTQMKPSLLIIGPGLIGGSLLDAWLPLNKYNITVMARSAAQIDVLSELGVKTIQAGLQDLEKIGEAVESHDIIMNTASADALDVAYAAIAALKKSPTNSNGGEKIFVQISGAGVFGHLFSPHNPIDTVYDDAAVDVINSLSPKAPHRVVDLAWWNASQELAGKVKIAVLIPGTVFGVGTGPFNKISIQIPLKIKAALRDGYASYGRDGLATFANVSVGDLVSATTVLLEALETSKVDVTANPYFNACNRLEPTWLDVSKRIGADLYAKGKIATAEPKSVGTKYEGFGIYRARASRLMALGWEARDLDVLQGVSADVDAIIASES